MADVIDVADVADVADAIDVADVIDVADAVDVADVACSFFLFFGVIFEADCFGRAGNSFLSVHFFPGSYFPLRLVLILFLSREGKAFISDREAGRTSATAVSGFFGPNLRVEKTQVVRSEKNIILFKLQRVFSPSSEAKKHHSV